MGTDIASDRRALPRLRHTPIGRDHDIDAVVDLTAAAPVVTLTGPGGIGKTTLALAVAHRLRDRAGDDLPDGVIFADLSPLAPGARIAPLVADVAYVEGADGKTAAGLAPILAQRAALLVLDNCEHVLASASDLVDRVLEVGDGLRILATSRELLRVPGEHVWPLGTLGEAAPALFVERARAAEPRVAWRADDPSVVELCRRVDGVPLAVELAAGQLRRFDLPELLRRLDDRLEPLAARPTAGAPWGASDDAARHATMDAAIDWSYRLLERTEQTLLRHLSVFPAEFPLDAVEASAPPLGAEAPLAVFGQLVDKSLVVRRPGSGRYRLLETIRVFARDRLDESGEAAAALERHRRHQLEKVTAASRLDRWMSARLAAAYCTDAHDERQAFQLSLAAGAVGDAVEIGLGGAWLWRNARGSTEGQTMLDALGRLDVELAPRDRLWTSLLQADVSQGLGDHHRLFDAAAAASAVAPAAGDPEGACIAAHFVALGHFAEPDRAREHLDLALGFAHDSGDERLVTLNEAFLTVLDVTAGRYDEARAAMARLDRTASEDGYDRFITHWTGWMLGLAERDVAARRWMRRQQEYLDRTGIVETWITSFSTAMCDVVEGGDVLATLARTLLLADREGYSAAPDCVLVLAYAEICAGRFEAAAELVGTAMHARFNATAHTVLYRAVLAPALARHLDPDTLAAALHRGRARTPGSALATHGLSPL